MAVTQNGGHMNHSTVQNIGPEFSEAATATGGELAKSNKERLAAAYPASPMLGDTPTYSSTAVANLKTNLMTNTVKPDDFKMAAAYYGYSSPNSDEAIPSSADLTFSGAPDISKVATDVNGKPIASPYMPNLLPPDSFAPTADNPIPVILDPEKPTGGGAGVGEGSANPAQASAAMEEKQVPAADSGTEAGPAPMTAGSGGDGLGA